MIRLSTILPPSPSGGTGAVGGVDVIKIVRIVQPTTARATGDNFNAFDPVFNRQLNDHTKKPVYEWPSDPHILIRECIERGAVPIVSPREILIARVTMEQSVPYYTATDSAADANSTGHLPPLVAPMDTPMVVTGFRLPPDLYRRRALEDNWSEKADLHDPMDGNYSMSRLAKWAFLPPFMPIDPHNLASVYSAMLMNEQFFSSQLVLDMIRLVFDAVGTATASPPSSLSLPLPLLPFVSMKWGVAPHSPRIFDPIEQQFLNRYAISPVPSPYHINFLLEMEKRGLLETYLATIYPVAATINAIAVQPPIYKKEDAMDRLRLHDYQMIYIQKYGNNNFRKITAKLGDMISIMPSIQFLLMLSPRERTVVVSELEILRKTREQIAGNTCPHVESMEKWRDQKLLEAREIKYESIIGFVGRTGRTGRTDETNGSNQFIMIKCSACDLPLMCSHELAELNLIRSNAPKQPTFSDFLNIFRPYVDVELSENSFNNSVFCKVCGMKLYENTMMEVIEHPVVLSENESRLMWKEAGSIMRYVVWKGVVDVRRIIYQMINKCGTYIIGITSRKWESQSAIQTTAKLFFGAFMMNLARTSPSTLRFSLKDFVSAQGRIKRLETEKLIREYSSALQSVVPEVVSRSIEQVALERLLGDTIISAYFQLLGSVTTKQVEKFLDSRNKFLYDSIPYFPLERGTTLPSPSYIKKLAFNSILAYAKADRDSATKYNELLIPITKFIEDQHRDYNIRPIYYLGPTSNTIPPAISPVTLAGVYDEKGVRHKWDTWILADGKQVKIKEATTITEPISIADHYASNTGAIFSKAINADPTRAIEALSRKREEINLFNWYAYRCPVTKIQKSGDTPPDAVMHEYVRDTTAAPAGKGIERTICSKCGYSAYLSPSESKEYAEKWFPQYLSDISHRKLGESTPSTPSSPQPTTVRVRPIIPPLLSLEKNEIRVLSSQLVIRPLWIELLGAISGFYQKELESGARVPNLESIAMSRMFTLDAYIMHLLLKMAEYDTSAGPTEQLIEHYNTTIYNRSDQPPAKVVEAQLMFFCKVGIGFIQKYPAPAKETLLSIIREDAATMRVFVTYSIEEEDDNATDDAGAKPLDDPDTFDEENLPGLMQGADYNQQSGFNEESWASG